MCATCVHPVRTATWFTSRNPSSICVILYIFLGSLSVLTICGNLLVIASIVYFKQLHTPTNYLILSLAVADLLVGVVVFPFSMAFTVTSCLYHEGLFCKIRDSFDVTLCTSSILNLCCISIDRYYAVCQPLLYKTKINAQVTLTMILLSWGISVLIGIGIIVAGFSQGTCEEMCSVDVVVANTMGPVFSFYFPAVIMVCIYLKIFLVAQRQVNSIHNSKLQSTKSAASKMERKATKTLAIVMGVFLLCLTPYFICVLLSTVIVYLTEPLNWFAMSNSMFNPFIYAFFYKWFRTAFRLIISGKIFQANLAHTKLY
uniref:Trace amine associated receptor 1 n=1 Tax=Salarias fasciatus TaxID=181472 RepID=A0A672FAP3_SALFA